MRQDTRTVNELNTEIYEYGMRTHRNALGSRVSKVQTIRSNWRSRVRFKDQLRYSSTLTASLKVAHLQPSEEVSDSASASPRDSKPSMCAAQESCRRRKTSRAVGRSPCWISEGKTFFQTPLAYSLGC